MGKVLVTIKLTNLSDEILRGEGFRKSAPRQLAIRALVDTGATRLYLKPSVIRKLGLKPVGKLISSTTNGKVQRTQYAPVRLDRMGRRGNFDVVEVGEDVPNLLGQVPLEVLDLVVDSKRQKLVGNPEHGGGTIPSGGIG